MRQKSTPSVTIWYIYIYIDSFIYVYTLEDVKEPLLLGELFICMPSAPETVCVCNPHAQGNIMPHVFSTTKKFENVEKSIPWLLVWF